MVNKRGNHCNHFMGVSRHECSMFYSHHREAAKRLAAAIQDFFDCRTRKKYDRNDEAGKAFLRSKF